MELSAEGRHHLPNRKLSPGKEDAGITGVRNASNERDEKEKRGIESEGRNRESEMLKKTSGGGKENSIFSQKKSLKMHERTSESGLDELQDEAEDEFHEHPSGGRVGKDGDDDDYQEERALKSSASYERSMKIDLKKTTSRDDEAQSHYCESRGSRVRDLSAIIKLNTVSYSMFDSPKIPYEIFIRIFGRRNTAQKSCQVIQSNDSSDQTYEIIQFDESTQFPFIYREEEDDDVSSCNTFSDPTAENTGKEFLENLMRMIPDEKIIHQTAHHNSNRRRGRRKSKFQHKKILISSSDPFRLNHFLLKAEKVISSVVPWHQGKMMTMMSPSSAGDGRRSVNTSRSISASKSGKRIMKIPEGSEGFCSQFYKLIPSLFFHHDSIIRMSSPRQIERRRSSVTSRTFSSSFRNPVVALSSDSSYLICVQNILVASGRQEENQNLPSDDHKKKKTHRKKSEDEDDDDNEDDDEEDSIAGNKGRKDSDCKVTSSSSSEESVISLWPLRPTQSSPDHLLRSRSLITCIKSDDSHVIYGGSGDGSVSIWDLRDPIHLFSRTISSCLLTGQSGFSLLLNDQRNDQDGKKRNDPATDSRTIQIRDKNKLNVGKSIQAEHSSISQDSSNIRGPSYSTACVNQSHESSVMSLTLSRAVDDHSNQIIRLYSLDEANTIICWKLQDLIKADSSFDLMNGDGMCPGARIKLIKDHAFEGQLNHVKKQLEEKHGSVDITCMTCHPVIDSCLMVGFSSGHVVKLSKFSQNNNEDENGHKIFHEIMMSSDSLSSVSCIQFNNVLKNFFLTGFEDGTICLFQDDNSNDIDVLPILTFDSVDTQITHVLSINWFPKVPNLFSCLASSSNGSTILLFNLQKNKSSPLFKYEDQLSKITCMAVFAWGDPTIVSTIHVY